MCGLQKPIPPIMKKKLLFLCCLIIILQACKEPALNPSDIRHNLPLISQESWIVDDEVASHQSDTRNSAFFKDKAGVRWKINSDKTYELSYQDPNKLPITEKGTWSIVFPSNLITFNPAWNSYQMLNLTGGLPGQIPPYSFTVVTLTDENLTFSVQRLVTEYTVTSEGVRVPYQKLVNEMMYMEDDD